jgi:hypothetical protein
MLSGVFKKIIIMENKILIAFIVILIIWCAFISDEIIKIKKNYIKKKPKKFKKGRLLPKRLYCFECEIEMSVKKYKGFLCCGNCGLRH